jgi:adenosylcobyric acid synthase
MLGQRLRDPLGIESPEREAAGMGLLPVETEFTASKDTYRIEGEALEGRGILGKARGLAFQGYEIHMGQTSVSSGNQALRLRRGYGAAVVVDGCLDAPGRVLGTYVHGLFHNTRLRRAILEQIAEWKGTVLPQSPDFQQDLEYDKLADLVRRNLKIDLIYQMTGLSRVAA